MVASKRTSRNPANGRRPAAGGGVAGSEDPAGRLVEEAERFGQRAPELALVLGERAASLAEAAGSNELWIRAESVVVHARVRLGHRASTVGRAVAALRAAEDAGQAAIAAQLRTDLAVCARSVGTPLTGLAVLRPVLTVAGLSATQRATALSHLVGCLGTLGRRAELDRVLLEGDRLVSADGELDEDGKLQARALIRVAVSAHRRRHGDLVGAADSARTGIGFLDQLEDPSVDGGVARVRLVLELVCALLDRGELETAAEIAEPVFATPERAATAAPACWLRLAIALRVLLPGGAADKAARLLREAVHSAERHGLHALAGRLWLELAHVEERTGDPAEAIRCLHKARAAEHVHARARSQACAALTGEFGSGEQAPVDLAEIVASAASAPVSSAPAAPAAGAIPAAAAARPTEPVGGRRSAEGAVRTAAALTGSPSIPAQGQQSRTVPPRPGQQEDSQRGQEAAGRPGDEPQGRRARRRAREEEERDQGAAPASAQPASIPAQPVEPNSMVSEPSVTPEPRQEQGSAAVTGAAEAQPAASRHSRPRVVLPMLRVAPEPPAPEPATERQGETGHTAAAEFSAATESVWPRGPRPVNGQRGASTPAAAETEVFDAVASVTAEPARSPGTEHIAAQVAVPSPPSLPSPPVSSALSSSANTGGAATPDGPRPRFEEPPPYSWQDNDAARNTRHDSEHGSVAAKSVLDRLGISAGSAGGGRRRAAEGARREGEWSGSEPEYGTPGHQEHQDRHEHHDPHRQSDNAIDAIETRAWNGAGRAEPAVESSNGAEAPPVPSMEGGAVEHHMEGLGDGYGWLPRLRLPPSLAPLEDLGTDDFGATGGDTTGRSGSHSGYPVGGSSAEGAPAVPPPDFTGGGHGISGGFADGLSGRPLDDPPPDAGLAELLARALAEHQAGSSSASALVKQLGTDYDNKEEPRTVNGRNRNDR
ncbi:hypothetical protein BAY61_08495 [Prauserella marina]|uniref:Uncharacterized protein n=1 Tax=Prauserella marina TaxID=530584 RepID=A0A222VMN9_9PSEU|nr:hypothetical protein [Prauserella marina]ASR35013.1 hypothetical protein BAY61_08495 [Prauserella marina]PWV85255.1 hypothetical protein DES30_1011281 [Prauserella marina]SDC01268.1 hypothetical protein SAMN05421630_10157 [Prauserella marina]